MHAANAETLLNGSVVCWSEDVLKNYIAADKATKQHMEKHECLAWYKEIYAKVIQRKTVTILGTAYSIANIELRYEYYGERNDNVWTFTKFLSK